MSYYSRAAAGVFTQLRDIVTLTEQHTYEISPSICVYLHVVSFMYMLIGDKGMFF